MNVRTPLFDPRLGILNQESLRKARDVAKDGFANDVLPRQVVDEAILTYVESLPQRQDIEALLDDFVSKIGTADGAHAARGRIVAAFAADGPLAAEHAQ